MSDDTGDDTNLRASSGILHTKKLSNLSAPCRGAGSTNMTWTHGPSSPAFQIFGTNMLNSSWKVFKCIMNELYVAGCTTYIILYQEDSPKLILKSHVPQVHADINWIQFGPPVIGSN